jgi:ribose/xylose/arabinose/galactoside ABC-type transport system permease subunit
MLENPDSRKSSMHTAKDKVSRLIKHESAVLVIVLVVLIGVFSFVSKGLTTGRNNLVNILLQSSIRGVASMGQAFVILTSGIDLSVGGVGLFSALLGSLMLTQEPTINILGGPVPAAGVIPVMLFSGAVFGLLNGLSVSRIGMPPLIVTLAAWEISKGLAWRISGGFSVGLLEPSMAFVGQGEIATVPVPVIIFIVVAVISYFVLSHSTFGRSIYAVGGNPVSAWLTGINVKKVTLIVYIISGFLAGLAAVIMTGRVMSASMRTLEGLELDSIAAVCIGGVSLMGGRGNIIGVILGVVIIGVINNGMSVLGVSSAVYGVVKGAIIFAAVAIDYIRRRR